MFKANFDFLKWYIEIVSKAIAVIFVIIAALVGFFEFKTWKGIKEYKKELSEKLKGELNKHKEKLLEENKKLLEEYLDKELSKKDFAKKIIESVSAKIEVKDKRIMVINSGEKNFREEEEKLFNNFNNFSQNKIEADISGGVDAINNTIKINEPDLIIFDPNTKPGGQEVGERQLFNDPEMEKIIDGLLSDAKIPFIIYARNGIYSYGFDKKDEKEKEKDMKKYKSYPLANFANSPFTLASWSYTILKVTSLKSLEQKK
jgi:hypothetical protein